MASIDPTGRIYMKWYDDNVRWFMDSTYTQWAILATLVGSVYFVAPLVGYLGYLAYWTGMAENIYVPPFRS